MEPSFIPAHDILRRPLKESAPELDAAMIYKGGVDRGNSIKVADTNAPFDAFGKAVDVPKNPAVTSVMATPVASTPVASTPPSAAAVRIAYLNGCRDTLKVFSGLIEKEIVDLEKLGK